MIIGMLAFVARLVNVIRARPVIGDAELKAPNPGAGLGALWRYLPRDFFRTDQKSVKSLSSKGSSFLALFLSSDSALGAVSLA